METIGFMTAPNGVGVRYIKEYGTVTVTHIEDRNGFIREARLCHRNEIAPYQAWLEIQPAA